MAPIVSVITPASRGVKELSTLLNDFKNQTARSLMEHIIVYDGKPPEDVVALMAKAGPWTRFTYIKKDPGNMKQSPGTNPRNHGITLAKGQYVVFCDDDDRYKDRYLETLLNGMGENVIGVVQMSCQESRMYKKGSPDRSVLVPEIGLPVFPTICHVGTPCFMVKREWAVENPWRHEPEHDFRFIKRICEKYNPRISIIGGLQVDVDSQIIGHLKNWVSIPPFYRD